MKDRRNLPQNKVDLKKMKIAIKKTSLMIDELDLKEEEEMEFRLTTEEQNRYVMLKDVFKNNRYPSHDIKSAIEDEHRLKNIRKDYLAASKVQIERKNIKDSLSNDSVGTILLASGAPVMLIGAMLLDTFIVAGIGVIAVGVAMTMPMFLKEITQKRTAKKG